MRVETVEGGGDDMHNIRRQAKKQLLPLPPSYKRRFSAPAGGSSNTSATPVRGAFASHYGLGYNAESVDQPREAINFIASTEQEIQQ